ncbi:MAG: hypothetical protein FJW69_08515, partial [Actinobacteria bacterium]|nr:hypothetical protein [Actinomycetota bacterium]
MQDFSDKLSNYLKNNKLAKDYSSDLIISGKNPWELRMILSWKEIGKLEISSFELEDIWALRDWWINTLSYD